MIDSLLQLGMFSAKALILVIMLLVLLAGIVGILSRSKDKLRGHITIKHLNEKYQETQNELNAAILSKTKLKQLRKEQKKAEKAARDVQKKNIFVLNFDGDIKASAVAALREEVTAILSVATPQDEVVVKLESGGGMVHAYGLGASQLMRIRQQNIPLTVIVDKIAASGGYMMACIGNKLLAAPFAIIGSIGVIVQMPNFHRLLREKNIDFEQLTAGKFKRTLTLFGENTQEGREKMHEEIEDVHRLFKDLIRKYRPMLDIEEVATGEHWLGSQALTLQLVDALTTSDDYLFQQNQQAELYEVRYHTKKSLLEKISASTNLLGRRSLEQSYIM